MKRSRVLLAASALFVAAVVGCQSIAGIQSRTTDPLVSGCTLPGVAGTPSTGNGKIRLVNLETKGVADFCVRTSGAASWGRPILRDGGNDSLCLVGLQYQQSTVPFSVPAGKIDVKAIPAGQTCAAAATSEIDGVTAGDTTTPSGNPVTIVRWGNEAKEALAALPERKQAAAGASAFRIVNALASAKPVVVGVGQSATLPTTLDSVAYASPILPGAVEVAGKGPLGTIDAEGYLSFLPAPLTLAVALASDTSPSPNAIVAFGTSHVADTATLYVVGDPADNAHPVRGLYCEDFTTLAAAISSGTVNLDAGATSGDAGAALTMQDYGLLAQCTPTNPPLISVDTFNVGLYGANAPFEQDRRPAIYAAIQERVSDVMCVIEVNDLKDRNAIASAAGGTARAPGQYPYAYSITTGMDTQPTLAADQSPPPTVAPCDPSTGVKSTTLDNIFNCVNASCSTNPNDPAMGGSLDQSTNCLSNNCAQAFLPIYQKNRAINGCFDCIIYYLTSELPIAEASSACTTDTRQPLAFLGQNPSMILSHYPLSNQHAYILPATGFRRAVLQATVTLEDNQKFDFFCAQLSSPLTTLPYTGNYGNDNPNATPPENGWEDEQKVQVAEVISFVQAQVAADHLPAILAGDWVATNGGGQDAGASALASLSPEIMVTLSGASGFAVAEPPGYTPVCDDCPSSGPTPNLYNTSTGPLAFLTSYLIGFPAGSTQSETVWGTGNIVSIAGSASAPAPPGGKGPLAEDFPRNVTVLRPPTH